MEDNNDAIASYGYISEHELFCDSFKPDWSYYTDKICNYQRSEDKYSSSYLDSSIFQLYS